MFFAMIERTKSNLCKYVKSYLFLVAEEDNISFLCENNKKCKAENNWNKGCLYWKPYEEQKRKYLS